MNARILPSELIQAVDTFISDEHENVAKYDNRHLLDYDGAWSLQKLAAEIYARGWLDGERAEAERNRGERARERDARLREGKS